MENPLFEKKRDDSHHEAEDIDELNDETFGDGAIEGDWETAHYVKTGESHNGATSPQVPLQHQHIEGTLNPDLTPEIAQLKNLWPSSPQPSNPFNSIWSSPELPTKAEMPLQSKSSSTIPPGSKVFSLEELEREITRSPPLPPAPPSTSSTSSTSPHPQPLPISSSSSSSSPAHMTPPPPRHMIPPPGIIQHPPPGLPHPLPPRGMPQMVPWFQHMPVHGATPPPHGFRPLIPPPNIPILRQGPGHPILPPHHLHQGRFPLPQGPPFLPPHPPFNQPNIMARKSKRSEYLDEMKADGSGFMTQKEKDWVIKVQLVQLHTHDSENEDYYYQNYKKREMLRKQQEPEQSNLTSSQDNNNNSPSSTPSQTRPLPEITPRAYKPKEFQGALGKVSVSSIVAPRKMIDIPLSSEGGGKETVVGNIDGYMKKKQALIIIEKLYSVVLDIEDLEKKSFSVEKEEEKAELLAKKGKMAGKIFTLLRLKSFEELHSKKDVTMLHLVMNYRKGKRVIKRALPFLNDDQACAVILAIFHHLPSIVKRDSTDQVLAELLVSVSPVVPLMDLHQTTKCISALLMGITSSSTTTHLLRVCSNKFGAELLLLSIQRGCELQKEVGLGEMEERNKLRWNTLMEQLHGLLSPHRDHLSSKAPKATTQILQHLIPH